MPYFEINFKYKVAAIIILTHPASSISTMEKAPLSKRGRWEDR
jgi:hypothetical protein